MKAFFVIVFLVISFNVASQTKEVQNYIVDSARKKVSNVWQDWTRDWEHKLVQISYADRVVKIIHSETFSYDFKMVGKMEFYINPQNNNRIYVMKCTNSLSHACKLYIEFPPEGVQKNFVTLFVEQPLVEYMFYLKAF